MIEVVRERQVPAAPPAIWPLVADLARLGEWLAFADRFELLGGDGVGRRQRLHGRWGAKRSEIDQVVTAFQPERRLAWRHEAERLDGKPAPRFARATEFAIELEPAGEGTMVRLSSRQEPAGAVRGLVMRVMGTRDVAARMDRSLDRLAALVAAPPGP